MMNLFDKDGLRTAVPVMTHPGIELISHSVRDAVSDGQIQYEAIQALEKRFPSSAALSMIMDLSVEAEAFGAEVSYSEDAIPSVIGRLLKDVSDIEKLELPSLEAARIPEYLKADALCAKLNKALIAGCIGPFSLAGRLYGMTETMMGIYIETNSMLMLLDKCTEFLLKYVRAIKDTGADAVLIAEPAAGLLSNEDVLNYSTPYVKKIVDALQDEDFSIILHNCGNTGHCTQAMLATGAWGYHFGNKVDMLKVLEDVPSGTPVMGNLDPVSVFKQASASEVYAATTELLTRTAAYPNFILSSGCDVPPRVPMANIEAFYSALSDYNNHTNE